MSDRESGMCVGPEDGPQHRVAQLFMRNKGYPDVHPTGVEKDADDSVWYFDYQLPDGPLQLQVSWQCDGGWDAAVTGFTAR